MNGWAREVITSSTRVATRWRPTPIICHAHQILYYPIPKVGTSTVRTLIANADDLSWETRPQDADFERIPPWELGRYRAYRSLTAVRSPWSRLASCYRQKIAESSEREGRLFLGFARYNRVLRRRVFWPEMTFEEFVAAIARIPDPLADEHFRSQFRQLPVSGGAIKVDVVLRVDDPALFASGLSRIFGVGVPTINATRQAVDWRDLYTPRCRRLVARRYRTDVDLLGYASPWD